MQHIPDSQAAYQPGRSTTEHVFAYKLLAEKAITSNEYTSNIILMDTSKAFDKVDRETLLKYLQRIVEKYELHLLKLLLDKMELTVKCGNTFVERFETNQGVPQGDCLSPILFILYLAKELEHQPHQPHLLDHCYAKPEYLSTPEPTVLLEHDYYTNKQQLYEISKQVLTIDTEYADDVGKNILCQSQKQQHNSNLLIQHYKQSLPNRLKHRNLQCNPEKTEGYTIGTET